MVKSFACRRSQKSDCQLSFQIRMIISKALRIILIANYSCFSDDVLRTFVRCCYKKFWKVLLKKASSTSNMKRPPIDDQNFDEEDQNRASKNGRPGRSLKSHRSDKKTHRPPNLKAKFIQVLTFRKLL